MATAKRVDKKKGHRPPASPHEQAFPMLDNASIVTPIKQTPSKDNTMPEVTRLSANDDVYKNDINNPTTLNDLLQQTTDGRGEEHAQLWGMDGTRSMDSVAEMVNDTEGKDDERPTTDMNMANTSAKPSRMLLSPSGYSGGTSHAASNTPESFLLNVSIFISYITFGKPIFVFFLNLHQMIIFSLNNTFTLISNRETKYSYNTTKYTLKKIHKQNIMTKMSLSHMSNKSSPFI